LVYPVDEMTILHVAHRGNMQGMLESSGMLFAVGHVHAATVIVANVKPSK